MKLTFFTLVACTTTVCGSKFTEYLRELSPLTNTTNENQMNYTYNFTKIYSLDMFKKNSKSKKSIKKDDKTKKSYKYPSSKPSLKPSSKPSFKPVTPVAPVAPLAPKPITPPATPVAPVSPISPKPVIPVTPLTPIAPVAPILPKPVAPPVGPVAPVSPPPVAIPKEPPTSSPKIPTIDETLLNNNIFGPSSPKCTNYVPENGEYSFTVDLTSLQSFSPDESNIEPTMFTFQMSHDDLNENRTWSIRIAKGGNIYSFKGPFGESSPPNTINLKKFVDEVNQKVAVDSAKNEGNNPYFVHQAGVYQDSDPGYTDKQPYWFSPTIAFYCSESVPECRIASWGQHATLTKHTGQILYYDRYRDCGNGILERTHAIVNCESQNTQITFANMPWGGYRYSVLKDIKFSQSPSWNWDKFNLPGGMEDPMKIVYLDESYPDVNTRTVQSQWTKGYTIAAQNLPFTYTPTFIFPGREPPLNSQPIFKASYGPSNTNWMCRDSPLSDLYKPSNNNYCCRVKDPGVTINKGCSRCVLRFTNNNNGQSIVVWHVRNWFFYLANHNCYAVYFNSDETFNQIKQVFQNGDNISVEWEDNSKRPEDNLAQAFVHGKNNGRMRFGYANNYERDFTVLEYVTFPNVDIGDTHRSRQYYITDAFQGLESRIENDGWAWETSLTTIELGQLPSTQITLHYFNDKFGTCVGSSNNCGFCDGVATILACTGGTTPQLGKTRPLFHIQCGSNTYTGIDMYYFSNFPTVPFRVYDCLPRPTFKLIGYFSNDCGVLTNKLYNPNLCA